MVANVGWEVTALAEQAGQIQVQNVPGAMKAVPEVKRLVEPLQLV